MSEPIITPPQALVVRNLRKVESLTKRREIHIPVETEFGAERLDGKDVLDRSFGISVELSPSQSQFTLADYGIPSGNYTASLTIEGINYFDTSLSYQLADGVISIFGWYTDSASGLRVQGIPATIHYNGLGGPLGMPLGGPSVPIIVSIILQKREG